MSENNGAARTRRAFFVMGGAMATGYGGWPREN